MTRSELINKVSELLGTGGNSDNHWLAIQAVNMILSNADIIEPDAKHQPREENVKDIGDDFENLVFIQRANLEKIS